MHGPATRSLRTATVRTTFTPRRRVKIPSLHRPAFEESNIEIALSSPVELDSGLYVVSTPLGNLGDITLRALRVLRSVSCIYAEDTRRTLKLLNTFKIETPIKSCHAHNECERTKQILRCIESGEAVALVSDAGTPTISDPGSGVVLSTIEAGFRTTPIPGPTAGTTALVASGLDTSTFVFVGFLPPKQSDRRRRLEAFTDIPATLILYVAPSDLIAVLRSCIEVFGDQRRCCLAKELTKIHESFDRGTLSECCSRWESIELIKGEMTLLIEGVALSTIDISDEHLLSSLRSRFADKIALSEAVKQISVEFGIKKRRVYKLALSLKEALHSDGRYQTDHEH